MSRFSYKINNVRDMNDLVAQLNRLFGQLALELSQIQGTNGQTFQNTSTKIGLFSATPTTQASKISDPSGGATVDTEARTAIASVIDAIENLGVSSKT